MNHNEFAKIHHKKIKDLGYWDKEIHLATLLMLMVTEITKLYDEGKLNKPEKLADLSLRLYDFCGYYKIDLTELPEVESCSMWDMLSCLTNELEAYRVNINTNWMYIKRCLSIAYFYANQNNIDLEYEIQRKFNMLDYLQRKKI